MTTRYTRIGDGVEARIHKGYLFVRTTDVSGDFLIQGGRIGRVCKMPYTKTLEEAKRTGEYNDPYLTDIKVCIRYGDIIKRGSLIQ